MRSCQFNYGTCSDRASRFYVIGVSQYVPRPMLVAYCWKHHLPSHDLAYNDSVEVSEAEFDVREVMES